MAIVKPIKVRQGNLAGLRAVLEYIQDGTKTQDGKLVYGKDVLRGMEFQQMVIVKRAFHKDSGRQYAHFVQSFDPKDDVSTELAFSIGQDFIRRFGGFEPFQVVMAVHTNEPQVHIHYVINSVSPVDGRKWQSSPEDLNQMRALSDELCREHGLSVIEKQGQGHKSYGEHTAAVSWKQQLAQDVAECLSTSFSRADFIHTMADRGVDVDVGSKSILFTVSAGVYGLKDERKCSNFKLLSYGDFSTENVKATWKCNRALADIGKGDMQLMQDVLLELGQLHCPDEPDHFQDMYLRDIDFDGKTKQEIEISLSRKALEAMLSKARQAHEQAEMEHRQSGLLLATIADTLAEIQHWQGQQQNIQFDSYYQRCEDENEFEL